MGEGPSIRRIISTKPVEGSNVPGGRLELEVTITDCDEYFQADGPSRTYNSSAVRRSWKRRMFHGEPQDGEAIFHFNMRRQLSNQYGWRFELNSSLSDPLA